MLTRAVDNPDEELCAALAHVHAELRSALEGTAVAWRELARALRGNATLASIAAGIAYDIAAGDVEDILLVDATTVFQAVSAANARGATNTTEPDGG